MKTLLIILLTINTAIASSIVEEIKKELPSWDKTTEQRVQDYAPVIVDFAKALNIKPELLLSIAWAESHFDPSSISIVGALGIMQVKPNTQSYIFKKTFNASCKLNKKNEKGKWIKDIEGRKECQQRRDFLKQTYTQILKKHNVNYKIIDNIFAGALYVEYLLKRFNGDVQKTVIAYNEGPSKTKKLIKKNENLDKHRYFKKIQKNLLAMQ